jgi:hypothetical protein
MGWTDKDAVPNAVRLGLADGKSTHLHGLTRKTVKFTFNPGSPTTISIAVRAVVTDAPYDFLVGNIILWTIGGLRGSTNVEPTSRDRSTYPQVLTIFTLQVYQKHESPRLAPPKVRLKKGSGRHFLKIRSNSMHNSLKKS